MRVVVAPDAFKGTCSAASAARAITAGWRRLRPHDDVRSVPLADGGEGTLDAFAAAFPPARPMSVVVRGPDDRPVTARWLLLPDGTGVIELAESSGLPLMAEPDAVHGHTVGLGETIRAALAAGARQLAIALGGSASTDGGTGALSALGARFLDTDGEPLEHGGGSLERLAGVDLDQLLDAPPGGVVLLVDVTAPLCGPAGAAARFGPQKGATPAQVEVLEAGLRRLAAVATADPEQPGSGAAGGTSFGLAAWWGARIAFGAPAVAHMVGLDAALAGCDAVVTGEGRFDATSLHGKVVGHLISEVRKLARAGERAGLDGSGGAGEPGAVLPRRRPWVAVAAGEIAAPRPEGVDEMVELKSLAGGRDGAMGHPTHWLERAGGVLAERFTAQLPTPG